MKVLAGFFVTTFVIIHSCIASAEPKSGFYLPETICEATLTYRDESGLIVLPVTINNTIHVNLILDTGCRNLILFGKRFEKLFNVQPGRKVEFSGLGDGNPIAGTLALNNKVALQVLSSINDLKVSIPKDMAFISFDDSEAFPYLNTPISALKQPIQEIGKETVNQLIRRLSEEHIPGKCVEFSCQFVARSSH